MTFSVALEQIKAGKKVSRAGWNGKGMFVFLQEGSEICANVARNKHIAMLPGDIKICPHIDMKAADGSIVIGWLASQTDLLSDDWGVVE